MVTQALLSLGKERSHPPRFYLGGWDSIIMRKQIPEFISVNGPPILFIGIVLSVFVLIIWVVMSTVDKRDNTEITPDRYQSLQRDIEMVPSFKSNIKRRLDDDKITRLEYKELLEEFNAILGSHEKNQLKLELE